MGDSVNQAEQPPAPASSDTGADTWFRISCSDDAMRATLSLPDIPHPLGEKEFDRMWQALTAHLTSLEITEGIRHGLLQHALREWIETGKAQTCIAAEGKAPKPGKDAELSVLFKPGQPGAVAVFTPHAPKPATFPFNIPRGTPLGKKRPAVPGPPGMTVTGTLLPAPPPKDLDFELTEHVDAKLEADGSVTYIAKIDGILEQCTPTAILLTDHLTVPKNLQEGESPMQVWGKLTLQGDLAPHTALRTRGDTLITGGVENAFVECKGDLVVKGGIFGSSTEVKTAGACTCRFAQNVRIDAGGDVTVEDSVVNSDITSTANIHIVERRGLVLHSRLSAHGRIEGNAFGGGSEGHIDLSTGIDPELWRQVARLEKSLKVAKRQHLKGRILIALKSERLRPTFARRIGKPTHTSASYERLLHRRKAVLLSQSFRGEGLPGVLVRKEVHPNTRVSIGHYHHEVHELCGAGQFLADSEREIVYWKKA